MDKKILRIAETPGLDFYSADTTTVLHIPYAGNSVPAGFPSPADDYLEPAIDLNRFLIKHPAATFYVRVKGNSMEKAGIRNGDLLVVDRAEEMKEGSIVIAILDGEFTVKRISLKKGKLYLVPENDGFEPIEISKERDFEVWGLVSYVIHKAD